jgi:hypothetical protein
MMSEINDDLREIIDEVDADGSGFRTGEVARLLVNQYVTEGVCDGTGEPKPKVRALMRIGAGFAV